jgi:hypothetical protein
LLIEGEKKRKIVALSGIPLIDELSSFKILFS